ncbi:DNA N-6-adenine-methyltransferase [Terrabacter sp. C0L_2]|uniref:DNA N-6-adenine-methyltransferase n=1 Tax=Terrabacter sp. C0L_2 TaxID=3108389 RepID=UPI002ED28A8D|nr:DNA N-6-adenine-methyltransferase [Terrabacter sp. C0L_2]
MSATTSNPAIAKVMFSSASDDWATPQAFYDALDAEFGFILDACSSTTNHKAPHFFALDHPDPDRRDGLAGDWAADARTHQGAVWLNPVYGRTIGDWMAKAAATARAGATVVCLVPARTDTRWFHDHVLAEGAEVRYVRGRLKFGSATTGAPFASLVIIYRGASSVGAAEESSAEVVATRPQGDVQDVLESGDRDEVRPGSAAHQVVDGCSGDEPGPFRAFDGGTLMGRRATGARRYRSAGPSASSPATRVSALRLPPSGRVSVLRRQLSIDGGRERRGAGGQGLSGHQQERERGATLVVDGERGLRVAPGEGADQVSVTGHPLDIVGGGCGLAARSDLMQRVVHRLHLSRGQRRRSGDRDRRRPAVRPRGRCVLGPDGHQHGDAEPGHHCRDGERRHEAPRRRRQGWHGHIPE